MVSRSKKQESVVDQFFKNVLKKPQVFFAEDSKVSDNALAIAKHFYDTAKRHEVEKLPSLDELLVKDFDIGQIWEEIAMQNEPFLDLAERSLKQLSRMKERKPKDIAENEAYNTAMSSDSDSHNIDQDEDEIMYNDDSDEELEESEGLEEDSENDAEDDSEEPEEEIAESSEDESPKKRSEVDDDFFSLEKFNKWTEEQEEKDMLSDRDDDEDGEEQIDYTRDLINDDDLADDINYNDFFVAPKKQLRPFKEKKKRVTFEETNNEEEDEEEETLSDSGKNKISNLFEDDQKEDNNTKSAYEKQNERVQAQIKQFESENVSDKRWTLRGETTSKLRPVNSLLEEDLEFDHSSKPVPVVTQETTHALEDMIKKRISDNTFDDVERREDPTFRPFLPSKRVELSDEKSKKSLAELYEDEFVKQSTGNTSNAKDEALQKEHDAISAMLTSLTIKLDSLSNFHYTPKPAKPELTVVSNAAAISMEEVTPVNVSDATLLAPEEIYDKKHGEVKNATEMSQEERKRARAVKKKMKRKDEALKERERKVIEKMRPGLGLKQAKEKAARELLGQKNVTIIGQEKDGKKKNTPKTLTAASLF